MATSPTTNNPELSQLREEVDLIDQRLHNMLVKRFRLVEKIAAVKSSLPIGTMATYIPKREAEILSKHQQPTISSQNQGFIKEIYRAIFSATRRIQKKFTIGVHNKPNESALIAAIYHFGDYHHYQTNHDINSMIALLQDNKYDWIVVERDTFTEHNTLPENTTTFISAEFTLNCINKSFYALSTPQGETKC